MQAFQTICRFALHSRLPRRKDVPRLNTERDTREPTSHQSLRLKDCLGAEKQLPSKPPTFPQPLAPNRDLRWAKTRTNVTAGGLAQENPLYHYLLVHCSASQRKNREHTTQASKVNQAANKLKITSQPRVRFSIRFGKPYPPEHRTEVRMRERPRSSPVL